MASDGSLFGSKIANLGVTLQRLLDQNHGTSAHTVHAVFSFFVKMVFLGGLRDSVVTPCMGQWDWERYASVPKVNAKGRGLQPLFGGGGGGGATDVCCSASNWLPPTRHMTI